MLNDDAGSTDVDHSTEFGGTEGGGNEGLMNVCTLEDLYVMVSGTKRQGGPPKTKKQT